MDNLTTCEIIMASERASDMRKEFICTQDALHQSMLNSPWPILLYVASVFFIMFLVQRAANVPHRATPAKKPDQDNSEE
ncbi:MAG: hypothetical protein ACON4P_03485 [Candidatus Puniceispirillales bacterium]